MPKYKMSKDHRRLVGMQAASLQRAVALNGQIADRAAQLEKDLMRDAEGLRKAMAGEESQFRLRRLEAAYLKVMHRLAMVRRSHALAREHGPVDGALSAGGKVSGQAVADAIRKAVCAVLGIPASLLKGRVKGHWRTTESGKMVWVADHQDKRTKKAPEPTTGRQRSLFDEPEPASGGKPGQASLFGDDEAPARVQEQPKAKPQDKQPRAPRAKEGLHVRRVAKRTADGFENWQVLDGDEVLSSGHYSQRSAQKEVRRRKEMDAKWKREADARAQAQQPKEDENPAKAAAESVRQRAEGIAEVQGFLKERSRNVYQSSAKEYAAERDGKPYNAYDNVSMEELQQIQARQRGASQQDPSPAPKDADTFQQQQQAHNDLANETLRLQQLGEQQIPGIRLADAETAGHLYEMLQAGEIKQQEWDKYVRSVSDEGKAAPPPGDGGAEPQAAKQSDEPAAKPERGQADWDAEDRAAEAFDRAIRGLHLEISQRANVLGGYDDDFHEGYLDGFQGRNKTRGGMNKRDRRYYQGHSNGRSLRLRMIDAGVDSPEKFHDYFARANREEDDIAEETAENAQWEARRNKVYHGDEAPPHTAGKVYEVRRNGQTLHFYVGPSTDGPAVYVRESTKGADGGTYGIESSVGQKDAVAYLEREANAYKAKALSSLPPLTVRKGVRGFIDRLLQKGRVKGHWRQGDDGKMVWVAEYTNRRTKKPGPLSTAAQQQAGLFDTPAPAPQKPTPQAAGQRSMFDDEPDLQADNGPQKGSPEFKALDRYIHSTTHDVADPGLTREDHLKHLSWHGEHMDAIRKVRAQLPAHHRAFRAKLDETERAMQGHVTAHMDQRDKLAAKAQEKKTNADEDTPPPTAPTDDEIDLGREAADNDGTLDAQAQSAQDEEEARDEADDGTAARDKETEPAADAPKYAIDYHLRDTKGSTYTLEVTGPDRASIVVRDENGRELDRLSPRPTKAAEEDLLKIGSHKWLRKEPGTPEDSAAGLFSPGHKVRLPDGKRGVVVKRETVHMSAFSGVGVKAIHGYTVRLDDGTEKYTTDELHDEDWEPPTPEETEEQKAKRAAEEAEAEKKRRQHIDEEKAKRPEPEWSSFDAGEYRWDDGDHVYFLSRGQHDKSYTIHSYNRASGEYDRSFYTKSWKTQSGAQRYLDQFIAKYGTRYHGPEGWKRIDSRTGRPVTERKPKPAQDTTTTGTSSAGSTDTAGGAVIRDNPDWGSVEVKFPAKPSDEVRSRLKAEGFKWSGKQGVWYSKRPRAREVATEILGVKKSARRRHPLLGILGGRP